LATDTNSAELPPLGNELLAALRSNQLTMSRTRVVTRGRYWAAAGAAVAAMILLVVAIAITRSRSTPPITQTPLSASDLQNTSPSEKAIAKAPDRVATPQSAPLPNKNSAFDSHRPGKNTRRNVERSVAPSQSIASSAGKDVTTTETATIVNADSSAAEVVTDFMPVGYASAANMQDGGQLVRLELPRSALVAFGLPMNVNRYDEKVKADVFFGADGMARAIRFVQ
jgi:hypothetical protein